MQRHFDLAPGKAELPGDGRNRVQIPVAADKDPPLHDRQAHYKAVDYRFQLFGIQLVLHATAGRNAVRQFIEGQRGLAAAAFVRGAPPPLINRDPAGDLAQKD